MTPIIKRNLDDVAQLGLAAWMVASPFLLSYSSHRGATLTLVAVGAFLPLTTQFSIAKPRYWEEITNLVLAVFLLVSPFAIGFTELMTATTNTIVCGTGLGVLAIIGLVQQRRMERERVTETSQPRQPRPA